MYQRTFGDTPLGRASMCVCTSTRTYLCSYHNWEAPSRLSHISLHGTRRYRPEQSPSIRYKCAPAIVAHPQIPCEMRCRSLCIEGNATCTCVSLTRVRYSTVLVQTKSTRLAPRRIRGGRRSWRSRQWGAYTYVYR